MNIDIKQIRNLPVKEACLIATTGDITLSGVQVIDGVSIPAGSRALVRNQVIGSENGIYITSASAWSRALDADVTGDLLPNTIIAVQQGTVNGDKLFMSTNNGIITIGTTAIDFTAVGDVAIGTSANKDMLASATSADGDEACATGIVYTPKLDSFVEISVNGLQVGLGDGAKTKACYFSGDSGTTARAIANITSADKLYWNGSVAGYQLSITDKVDFNYDI